MTKREQRFIVGLTIGYTLLVLFFLFVGFGRAGNRSSIGFRYNYIPTMIPLRLPIGVQTFSIWFFNFGNYAAFIPFGILIPMFRKTNYLKFVFWFVFCITCVELLQMVTFLGSADIDDVILNSIGASVGYLSYKLASRNNKDTFSLLLNAGGYATLLTVIILTISTFLR